jgi:hypothetical protein
MKKESINTIITPIMELIYDANINSKDKTELMIILGKFLENYNFKEYNSFLYNKKLVKKNENI